MAVRIGDLLLQDGTITPAQLEEALKYQVIFGGKIGTNLIEMGVVNEDDIARVLGKKFGVPAVKVQELENVPRSVIDRFPGDLVQKYNAVPLSIEGRRITVAMTNPSDLAAVDAIAFTTGLVVKVAVVSELRMANALERYYDIQRDRRFIHVTRPDGLPRPKAAAPDQTGTFPPVTASPAAVSASADFDLGVDIEAVDDLGGTAEPSRFQGEPGQKEKPAPAMEEIWPDEEPRPAPPPPPKPVAASKSPPPAKPAPIAPAPPVEEIADAETVSENLAEARNRDDILDTLADFLAYEFPRSAVLLVRGDMALGWRGTIDGKPLKNFDQMRLPLAEPSVLKTVAESRAFYLGPIPRTPFNSVFLQEIGGKVPDSALLVPLQMIGRVVGIIYADGQGLDLGERLFEVQKLTAKAAMAFEILVLKNKILSM
ncbi:MAG: hypothetical protein A2091_13300 [Desulfuromonadales bacterium GWD2_61_12]|nr:MAG: hypothetical protein A2005_02910 [Desulfuromonadales bacterium GWC2_61_20]OGR35277.1 MAG: hypothetical protein A2091_13300 [Desulfuromonadales bacterium GWD2_61_12]HBT83939.1 hypothetical protein [Desulfuromonas sp.]